MTICFFLFLIKIMSELEGAQPQQIVGVPPEKITQAAKTGQPWGEAAAAAYRVSKEITSAEIDHYASELGLKQAKEKINGVENADPKIVELATKIVGGMGRRLGERGVRMLERARKQAIAAERHYRKAMEARERLLRTEEAQRKGIIARTLIESVPPWLGEKLVALAGKGEGAIEKIRRLLAERYHEWGAGLNTKRAEVNSLLGKYYYEAGSRLEEVATGIMERWPKEKRERLEQLRREEEGKGDRLTQIRERLRVLHEQFGQITEEGPVLARAATEEIETKEPKDVAGQRKVVEELTQKISEMQGGRKP